MKIKKKRNKVGVLPIINIMKAKTKKNEKIKTDSTSRQDFYLNEEAKNWDFSDYVRVTSGPRGMVLSFGKFIREDEKYGIFKEIILPYDVVESLNKIIKQQFDKLIEDGSLKRIEDKKGK